MANIVKLGGGGANGEIAITKNGVHDVKKYATANVNVISTPELVWQNASPTSSWAKDTSITVSGDYDVYLIEARYSTGNSGNGITCFGADATYGVCVATVGLSYQSTYRNFSFANKKLKFGYGFLGTTNNDGHAIPNRIWGAYFTL